MNLYRSETHARQSDRPDLLADAFDFFASEQVE